MGYADGSAILENSGLPAFPSSEPSGVYVMHYRLAVFIYLRLFRFQTYSVRRERVNTYKPDRWSLTGGDYTLAVGTENQIDLLIADLDRHQESEIENALRLRGNAEALQSRYMKFLQQLDYAIASRRLRGRCDLVNFGDWWNN